MKRTKTKALARCETAETTDTALQLIIKDLDILVGWANADADASAEADALGQAAEDHIRARTYARCRILLANAFKGC